MNVRECTFYASFDRALPCKEPWEKTVIRHMFPAGLDGTITHYRSMMVTLWKSYVNALQSPRKGMGKCVIMKIVD